MAEVKKTAVAKPAAKAVAAKATEVKEEVKTEAAATVKEAPKAAKKPAAKKTTTKKAAKKTTEKTTTTKTAGRKAAAKSTVNVQFSGKSYTPEDWVKSAKDVWEYDLNRKPEDFKSVELYVKTEESKVYYVINGEVSGDFNI